MFKKKQKKSHKNDEIYVDYSKDVDVKKQDDDQAKPEHYKALEVQDEIVVSTGQIKEAKQQELQDDFIKQRAQETENQQINPSEKQTQEEIIDTSQTDTIDDGKTSNENTLENAESEFDEDDSIDEKDLTVTTQEQTHEQVYKETEEEINHVQEDSRDSNLNHTIYPSFLREEFEKRGKTTPVREVDVKEEDVSEDIEEDYRKSNVVEEVVEEEIGEKDMPLEEEDVSIEKKQDLHSYFQTDSSVLKNGVKSAQHKNRHKKEEKAPLYQYKHHYFYSMDDFVSFLENNTAHIEHIAQEILRDEQFFRWLKEESNLFEESIIKMKKFKQDFKQ